MKKLLLALLFALFALLPSASGIAKQNETPCGIFYQDIYVMCTGETRQVFCNDGQGFWGIDFSYITVYGKQYKVTEWVCGGNDALPGTVVNPIPWVQDFNIAQYEYGESFKVICEADHQYINPFPNEDVAIDLYLCLDYFPYLP